VVDFIFSMILSSTDKRRTFTIEGVSNINVVDFIFSRLKLCPACRIGSGV